ncbi:MAG: NRDE family protein [Gammaproteobacteria bacterium]|nr:NRDE family protein [Gammaproteobacteria bacterium]
MNRDEHLARAKAKPPRIFHGSRSNAIMPIDGESGGSWIAVNDSGFVFCLLNHTAARSLYAGKRSRGLLIRALSDCTQWSSIDQVMQAQNLGNYNPFLVLIFCRNSAPVLYTWDQKTLKIQSHICSPVSSSSWFPRAVPFLRRIWLKRAQRRIASLAELESYHLQRKPLFAAAAINMKRTNTATLSMTTVQVTNEYASVNYRALDEPDKPVSAILSLRFASSDAVLTQSRSVDIQAIFTHYQPEMAARMSAVQWCFLRWLLCEKALNKMIRNSNFRSESQFYDQVINQLDLGPKLFYWRMPETSESPVFVSNHPTGGVDGLVTLGWLTKRFPDLLVVANDALEVIPGLNNRIVKINVFGVPKESVKNLQAAFQSQRPILIFAAGKTARYQQGKLDDGDWASAIATLARRYRRALVPMHIESHNSGLFYAVHRLRRLLQIKTNYEMLLLPRELLRPRVRHPSIYIDIPVQVQELTATGRTDTTRSQWLKQRSYALPQQFKEMSHVKTNSCGS